MRLPRFASFPDCSRQRCCGGALRNVMRVLKDCARMATAMSASETSTIRVTFFQMISMALHLEFDMPGHRQSRARRSLDNLALREAQRVGRRPMRPRQQSPFSSPKSISRRRDAADGRS